MVPDNFLSGWEGEFDPLKWIYVNGVFELFGSRSAEFEH